MTETDRRPNPKQAARHDYALSPMQAGMLFQALLDDPGGPSAGYDIEQLHLTFEEDLDAAALKAAWTLIVARHPILATSFQWEGLDEPRQAVNDALTVPLEFESWAGLNALERKFQLDEFLVQDRSRGFDLCVAPLMRIRVFHASNRRTELVWSFHHILLDGRSISPVLREVFLAYDAICSGQPLLLPSPPPPYSDFLAWLGRLERQPSELFFRELLAGKSAAAPLPGVGPALQPQPMLRYDEAFQSVSESVVLAARRTAERTNTSLGTLVQAAWALVLSRYTGDQDVLFGATRACRHSALDGKANAMIGLFTNTLPVRARLGADRTVAELLADIREQSLAMRNHEHMPLALIQRQAEFAGDNPLFETLLMFENQGMCQDLLESGDPHWAHCRLSLYEQPSVPLNLRIQDGRTFEIRAIFDRCRFPPPAVNRMLIALGVALSELSGDERRLVSELDVLPNAERRRILDDWNDTGRSFPGQLCIQELFEDQVARTPQALAVEMDGIGLTYRELDQRANRLAHALRGRGARPGVYVGVSLSRGLDLVVALLAVAKSGAAYVPLDPQYPRERLAFMVADAEVAFIVTEERYRAQYDAPLLVLDTDGANEVASMPTGRLRRLGSPQDICYAIFTSGSTGMPKGVVLSHRAVVNTLDWVTRTMEIGPGDRLLFVTSPCFDLSVYDTFGVLGAGGTVVIASSEILQDPAALANAVIEQNITIWNSAPAALQQLVPHFPNPAKTAPLRMIMLSGDWIPVALPNTLRSIFPNVKLTSLGGATEAAIWSNWFPIGKVDPRWTSIPYGKPIQNCRYHVLDQRLRPVPIGVAGDLYIGGACLANGYLNRDELTRARFVCDPFRTEKRLYKTGDIARYFEDGNLEFLGRADFQVKLRGYRVEMGEVESVLCGLLGVREAVCVAHRDASGHQSLIAYVALEAGALQNEETLKAGVAAKTPSFMVPSQVIVLSAMPLTQNGKLDRKSLPKPGTEPNTKKVVAPRSDLERRMVMLWEEILQRKPIGIREDFFKLGGHSLLAMLLVSRIKTRLGLDVPLSRVIKQPTIESLVESMVSNTVSADTRSYLVTFCGSGSLPPLFLFPGVGGNSFIYRDLPALLGQDQPVYAFEAIRTESIANSGDLSVEKMAEAYVLEVLLARPSGPYVLAGYSFGVLVALEVARQLRHRGLFVPLLVSLDGYAPGFPKRMPLPACLEPHLRALLEADAPGRVQYVKERLGSAKRRTLKWLGRAHEHKGDLPVDEMDMVEHRRRLWAQFWRTRNRYFPTGVEPCDLLLVKAEVQQQWIGRNEADLLYGWGQFVSGSVATVTIPGRHLTLFEGDKLGLIAQAMGAHIAHYAESSGCRKDCAPMS